MPGLSAAAIFLGGVALVIAGANSSELTENSRFRVVGSGRLWMLIGGIGWFIAYTRELWNWFR